MKKRILIVLAILVLVSLTVLAACDTHEHEYSWKYDENGHWQECACSEKTDKVAHADENSDEKCDVCGYNMHVHAYSWKSDAVNHWEECACGDKKAATLHVDVKNNQTQADGADGKCDVCAVEVYVVSYDMQGHGVAPQAQLIAKNGKAIAPAAPADDDAWTFDGWYKDAECETAFDFAAEAINEATTVYAKWTEDETAGASKAHAYVLTLGEDSLQSIAKGQIVYFVYSASLEGRYTISLGGGEISQKCTFTSDKAEGGYDGTHSLTLELSAGEKVYVLITCAEELASDAKASVMIAEVTDESLPEDYFLVGEYFGIDSIYSLEITDRTDGEHQTLTFNETAYAFRYVGGSLDRIYFDDTTSSATITTTYYLEHKADGSYVLSSRQNNGSKQDLGKLEYYVAQEPVALNKLAGYYVPAGSGVTGNIHGLYIYQSDNAQATSVRCLYEDQSHNLYFGRDLIDATYDVQKNRLTIEQYAVTLKLAADGSVASLKIGTNEYVYQSAAGAIPADKLPLLDNEEYRGTTHLISTAHNSQIFGIENNGMTVVDGNDPEGMYTIKVALGKTFDTYKVKVLDDGETIELYAEDGTTKLDTLTKYEYTFTAKDLATDGSANTLVQADFYKGLTYLKVTEGGWYTFTEINNNIVIYANVPEWDLDYYEFYIYVNDGVVMNLEEGSIVVVDCTNVGAGVSFKSTKGEAPKGMAEDNPFEYEEGLEIPNMNTTDKYYVEYTAPKAGIYAICAYYWFENDDGPFKNYIMYTIGDYTYGYQFGFWVSEPSDDEPYAVITLEAEQTIVFSLNREYDTNEVIDPVKVEIIVDYEPVVKVVIFTEDEAGTYVGQVEDTLFGGYIDISLTFDVYGKGVYNGSMEFDVTVSKNDDGTCSIYEGETLLATFEFNESGLKVNDEELGEISLEKDDSAGPVTPDLPEGIVYTGVLTSGNSVILILSDGNKATYIVEGVPDAQNADIQEVEGKYSFLNNFLDTHTFTISEDGTIEFHDGWYNVDGTLTKQEA